MNGDDAPSMVGYLAGVVGLAVASVGMMYAYYRASVPEFSAAFVANPVTAVEDDPLSLVLLLAAIVLVVLLFVLIIIVGAKHAPEERDDDRE